MGGSERQAMRTSVSSRPAKAEHRQIADQDDVIASGVTGSLGTGQESRRQTGGSHEHQ